LQPLRGRIKTRPGVSLFKNWPGSSKIICAGNGRIFQNLIELADRVGKNGREAVLSGVGMVMLRVVARGV
jgi:hypothetical protein